MSTVADIISLWPSAEHFAADIGVKYPSYGRVMKMRGRIPRRYWPTIVEAAATRSLSVTVADLELAHAVRAELEREGAAA